MKVKVTDHIHALKIPFQITDPSGSKIDRFAYVYLILGKETFLVDSGVASSERIIFDYLRTVGRRPEDLSLLILTHSHPDHLGAAKAVVEASGCEVAAHQAEVPWIEDIDLQARERPVPGFYSLVGGSVTVDRPLSGGEILDLGDLHLEVIHTPGHSRGSISLLLREDKALISGDAIPIPGDMPIYDDALESIRSIEELEALRGVKVLLSAWDDPREGGQAEKRMAEGEKYLQDIHEAVLKVKDASTDPMDLCRRVLRELGMPEKIANPLIARSFQSNLRLAGILDLVKGT